MLDEDALVVPGGSITAPEFPSPARPRVTRTNTIEELTRDLTERAGFARNQASVHRDDAADVHLRSFRLQLDMRTAELVKRDPAELLDEIAESGFAWRDIARMIGVSVPALRRWRLGEKPSGEHRSAIARLLAFIGIIGASVFDAASWMEIPLSAEAPASPIDLYANGHLDLVFDFASSNCTPEAALDRAEPGWRDRYRSDWEVAVADDGQPYIKPKNAR